MIKRLAETLDNMKNEQYWLNFCLGHELANAGGFIYNGIKSLESIRNLNEYSLIYEALYNLSIGFERLMKIAVVLLEVNDVTDYEKLEESLITHNHHALLHRITAKNPIHLSTPHYSFIQMLSEFYSKTRYDRFKLSSVYNLKREQDQLANFISKLLKQEVEIHKFFGAQNTDENRKKIGKCIYKLTSQIYEIIKGQSNKLNIYTYELPYGSKAFQVFIAEKTNHIDHRIARVELLLFIVSQLGSDNYSDFRDITPLDLDPGLISDYVKALFDDLVLHDVMDEIETRYDEIGGEKRSRIETALAMYEDIAWFRDEEKDDGF